MTGTNTSEQEERRKHFRPLCISRQIPQVKVVRLNAVEESDLSWLRSVVESFSCDGDDEAVWLVSVGCGRASRGGRAVQGHTSALREHEGKLPPEQSRDVLTSAGSSEKVDHHPQALFAVPHCCPVSVHRRRTHERKGATHAPPTRP